MREPTHDEQALARLRALAEEQAALRRVATLVAGDPEPSRVFQCVCEEVGTVLGIDGTNLTRFEPDGTQTVLAGWSQCGTPIFPVGGGVPLEGDAAVPKVSRSGRPERVDDYSEIDGELADRIRAAGIASAVAAPIKVAGSLWGAVVATNGRPFTFPPDRGADRRLRRAGGGRAGERRRPGAARGLPGAHRRGRRRRAAQARAEPP